METNMMKINYILVNLEKSAGLHQLKFRWLLFSGALAVLFLLISTNV